VTVRAGLIAIAGSAALALAACDLVFPPGTHDGTRDASAPPPDDGAAPPDAMVVLGPFSVPQPVPLGQTLPLFATDPTLTGDEEWLTYVVASTASTNTSIWTGARGAGPTQWTDGTLETAFGTNRPAGPKISFDGRFIGFFVEAVAPDFQIRARRRDSMTAPWEVAADFDLLNTSADDRISTPALGVTRVIKFTRVHPGPGVLVELQRADVASPWTLVDDSLSEIDDAQPGWHKHSPFLSDDGLVLVYGATPNIATPSDLYLATRTTVEGKFSAPARIDELADPQLIDSDPWLSADRRRIYFSRAALTLVRTDEWGIYFSERFPVPP
jgi:hypothetical protein